MSRKDFIFIARVIESLNFTKENKRYIAEVFAKELAKEWLLFNTEKFLKTCIGKENE